MLPKIYTVSGYCIDFSTQSVQPKVGEPKTEGTHQGPEIQSDTKTVMDGEESEDQFLKKSPFWLFILTVTFQIFFAQLHSMPLFMLILQ